MQKAKYYVDQYADAILLLMQNNVQRGVDEIIEQIFKSLSEDVSEICEKRHSRHNNAFFGALFEVNDKWNAIERGFEKKIGLPVLKKNGFAIAWFNEMPEIKPLYEERYGQIKE